MPANMMNAPTGSSEKVPGSRSPPAIAEPGRGGTPTAVPSTQPTTTQTRLIGVSARLNPCIRLLSWSTSHHPREEAGRQVQAQQVPEGQLDHRGHDQSDRDVEDRSAGPERVGAPQNSTPAATIQPTGRSSTMNATSD